MSSAGTAAPNNVWPRWLLLALALTLLAAQLVWNLYHRRQQIVAEAEVRLESHSLALANTLERQLVAIDGTLRFLRAQHGDRAHHLGIEHEVSDITALTAALDGVRALAILDAQGTVQIVNLSDLIGRNFAARDYFRALAQQPQPDRLHLSAPYTSVKGVYTLGLSRAVYTPSGTFAGVVMASLDTDGLATLMRSLNAEPGTRLSVVHGDGTLLKLIPENEMTPSGRSLLASGTHFADHVASGRPANLYKGESAVFARETVVSMRSIQPSVLNMDAPLVITASRDLDAILASWRAELTQQVTFFLLLATVASLGLWFLQRRQQGFDQALAGKEAESRRAHETLQRFVDHLPGFAYLKDDQSRTLMANRGFRTLLGLEPAAMLGKNCKDLFPAPFGDQMLADDRAVLESGKTTVIEEHLNGRDYETIKFVIEGADQTRQLGGITLDITERKAAQVALQQQNAELRELNRQIEESHLQLLQSEKLASIGQLAAGVAHELNNPISFVHSNLGALDDYLRDILEVADFCAASEQEAAGCPQLQHINALKREKNYAFLRSDVIQLLAESKDGLARVAKIVRDLKDFSRPGEGSWQWADLHAGLDSTLNIVWHELKYKCEVVKEYGSLPLVWCESSQLNQVFMNLLTNAGHAIADKGTITLRTGQADGEVWVAIHDTGSGISPENLKKIFDPFFTTKPVGKGTGLGLSLAYSIVEKHRGRIEVESTPGQGTTFTVRLPVQPENDADLSAATLPPTP